MFLSVVTRCYKRPRALLANIESLHHQTCRDWEQIFILDDVGHGIEWANQQLGANAHQCHGDYVLVLDDDDMFAEVDAIKRLHESTRTDPDMVIFRCDHGNGKILPDAMVWQQSPAKGRIGMCSWIVRRDHWLHFALDWPAATEADYHWLSTVWPNTPDKVWIDAVLTRCQNGRSWGAAE